MSVNMLSTALGIWTIHDKSEVLAHSFPMTGQTLLSIPSFGLESVRVQQPGSPGSFGVNHELAPLQLGVRLHLPMHPNYACSCTVDHTLCISRSGMAPPIQDAAPSMTIFDFHAKWHFGPTIQLGYPQGPASPSQTVPKHVGVVISGPTPELPRENAYYRTARFGGSFEHAIRVSTCFV